MPHVLPSLLLADQSFVVVILFLVLLTFCFMCMGVFSPCVSLPVEGAVSHNVNPGDGTRILWESNQCLSSPQIRILRMITRGPLFSTTSITSPSFTVKGTGSGVQEPEAFSAPFLFSHLCKASSGDTIRKKEHQGGHQESQSSGLRFKLWPGHLTMGGDLR